MRLPLVNTSFAVEEIVEPSPTRDEDDSVEGAVLVPAIVIAAACESSKRRGDWREITRIEVAMAHSRGD
jgi:hypothetical protein